VRETGFLIFRLVFAIHIYDNICVACLSLPNTNRKGYDSYKMENTDGSDQESSSIDALETEPVNIYTPETPKQSNGTLKFLSHHRRSILIISGLVFLLIISGVVISLVAKQPTKKPATTIIVNTQNLDKGTLNKLTSQLGSNSQVQQQLTITPDTLFKSDVDIQGSAKVQKNLIVEGTSTLQGAVSTGSNLTVNGNLSVNGLITAASLSVGSISISTINLSGDLNIGGHIIPTGITPSIKASVAASSGTTTISGNDTAGTIIINIGNGTLMAGEMVIVSFHKPFDLTPKVQLTPLSAAAANLNYFVTQSPTFFTIEAASIPIKGDTIDFNYFVTE